MREPHDWRLLYERERARTEAAEARCEELRWAEVAARGDAGSWKSLFEASRRKRLAAVEETKEARHAAKNALSLRAEVTRLTKLLREAGVESGRGSTILSLRREVAQLRKAVPGAEAQDVEIRRLRKALWQGRVDQATLRQQLHEAVRLYDGTRRLRDDRDRVRLLSDEGQRLRRSLKTSATANKQLKARLLRATEAVRSSSPSAEDAQLRKVLRRSRRQKATINVLSRANARLSRAVKASRNRVESLEADVARLHATRAVLSKKLYGRKSEKQEMPRSGRRRGQQPGAPSHGRTPRPRTRRTHRRASSAGRGTCVFLLRQALCGESAPSSPRSSRSRSGPTSV